MSQDKKPSTPRKSTSPRRIAGRPLQPGTDSSTGSSPANRDSGRASAPAGSGPRPGASGSSVAAQGRLEPRKTPGIPNGTSEGRDAGRKRSVRVIISAIALVVGLAAGIAGLALAVVPGDEPDNRAFVDQGTTEEVLRLASTHAQRLVAIDYTELDAYQESLDEFLAPNLVDELNETWDALSETYEQTQTAVDAQTQNVGLSFLTEDRAEVLLVLSVSMTRDGVASGSTTGTYLVELSRMDDTWKLSQIPDLPA